LGIAIINVEIYDTGLDIYALLSNNVFGHDDEKALKHPLGADI